MSRQMSRRLAGVGALVIGIALSVAGCGGEPLESKQSALAIFQTVPSHNLAEASGVYSCSGWSYRILFGWEQHQDPASPTGWYAAVGPSSPGTTGTLPGVSADVYLQCYWGILPHPSGTYTDGRPFDGLYVDMRAASPIPCTLTTIWPASWHLPNPVVPVSLNQYDYVGSSVVGDVSNNGTVRLDIDSTYPAGDPGKGWCGHGWYGGTVVNVTKLPAPVMPPPAPLCSQNNVPGCVIDPPSCTVPGQPPCISPVPI